MASSAAVYATPGESEGAVVCACPLCGGTVWREVIRGADRFVGGPGLFAVQTCRQCGLASTHPQIQPDDFELYYPETYTAYLEPADFRSGWARIGRAVDRLRLAMLLR